MKPLDSRHLQLENIDTYFNNHRVYPLRKQTKEKEKKGKEKNHEKLVVTF
jgi:hypothetical protein